MKHCPYCAEDIQDRAIKCKHCGSTLKPRDPGPANAAFGARKAADPSHDTLDLAATHDRKSRILANQYGIIKKIGEGGMGVVYFAEDMELGDRAVAIKVLPTVLSRNARAVENLRKEAMTAIGLNHPNIIRLYGFHADEDTKFLVMEYIDGETLEEKLVHSTRGNLPFEQTVDIVQKVAAALDYAHRQDLPVVHRDLKPSNIMIDKSGGVKVLDFGIAREMRDSYTRVTGQETSGTLPYMSPEQLRGKRAEPGMDIYALGAVCYECLSGHTPFHTGDIAYQIVHEPPERLDDVSDNVNDTLQRVLSKQPSERPATAGEFAALLTGRQSTRPVARQKPKPQPKPAPVPSTAAEQSAVLQAGPALQQQPGQVWVAQQPAMQYPGYAQTGQTGPRGKIRSRTAVILLAAFTLGIYFIIWFYDVWKEAYDFANHVKGVRIPSPAKALLLHVLIPYFCMMWVASLFILMSKSDYSKLANGELPSNLQVQIIFPMCFALIFALVGAFRMPGLIRKMEFAIGVPPHLAAHYGSLGFLMLVPYMGWLIWMGAVQVKMNDFWRRLPA